MQDKDFDQLFKDQFADAEITPSANLWSKIEQDLAPKKKKGLPVYWMAAACAMVVVSVVLLMPKGETIKLQGNVSDLAAVQQEAELKQENTVSANVSVGETSAVEQVASTPLVIAPRLTAEEVKKDFVAMQPPVAKSHPVNIDVPVADDMMAQIEEKVRDNDAMIASVGIQHEDVMITEPIQVEHKGIRNVGDLVNLVVNKVDKREKKLIQFNTDEDDNSSVIAINIGFLKFNRKDK